ncbi:MAG: glycosyltransferase family 39 protein [Anaerolineae bacterium]|nr:glycosyltransferase family 39 protein [Anaerolineae bacterium]
MQVSSKTKWITLLALTLIAGAIRFYRLDDFPPGLHFDEAFHLVEAIGVLDGITPIYFTENMGMDPMHIYMIALLFKAIGVTAIGGRLVSAIAGTLTVPATWWLAAELFAEWDDRRRTAISATSAFVLATLQWHITFSRTGIQPSLVPLLLVCTMAALWRGLRTGRWGWFAGAGVLLGAGPYAYSSSRMVPLLIVGVVVWLLLFRRDTLRRRWWGILLCVGIAIVVFGPLGYYFISHYEQFTFRTQQVTFYTLGQGSSDPIQAIKDNLVKTLLAFNVRGDMELIRNLPGRPALDLWQSFLFWLGLLVCLWHIKQPNYMTLLGWIAVMLLPTILTEFAPHFGRALGVTPAVAILVGLGTVQAASIVVGKPDTGNSPPGDHAETGAVQGANRSQPQRPKRAGVGTKRSNRQHLVVIVLSVGLVASAIGHLYAYFGEWGSQPGLYHAYDVGLLETSREVRDRVPYAGVYLSPIEMGHPIVRFMTWDRHGAKSYDGRYSLVLPSPTDRPADFIVVTYLDQRTLQRLPLFYPDSEIVKQGAIRTGTPFYKVLRVAPGSTPQIRPQHTPRVTWAGQLGLIGYDTDKERYQAGETVLLTLYWQSHSPADTDYTAFTHLLGPPHPDTDNPVWAGSDHEPGRASYPTSAWAAGEIVLDEFVLAIPANAPPGQYDLEIGFYQLETMQRLPISDATVQAGTDHAIIGQITVR